MRALSLAIAALLVTTSLAGISSAFTGRPLGYQCNCPDCQAQRAAQQASAQQVAAQQQAAAYQVQHAGHQRPLANYPPGHPPEHYMYGTANFPYGTPHDRGHPGKPLDGGYYGAHGNPHGTPGYPGRPHHMGREYVGPQGPSTGAVAYPYYTTRGPRDFFVDNPQTIGR